MPGTFLVDDSQCQTMLQVPQLEQYLQYTLSLRRWTRPEMKKHVSDTEIFYL